MTGPGASGPLRLGLVGCGRIAERGYVPAAAAMAGIRFTAIADPDPGRLRRCSELCGSLADGRAGHVARGAAVTRQSRSEAEPVEGGGRASVAAFSDAASLLEGGLVDALVVAAPAARHGEIAALAAAAGVPALVEKPPAPDLVGARRLAALGRPPAIGFNRRFLQGVELAPRVPAEGWLELDLELRFRRDGWGAHQARDEALLDAGIHLVDLATFLTGSEPIAVRRAAVAPERAGLELELGRGRARIGCATDRRYAERVEVRDRSGAQLAAHRLGPLRARAATLRGAPEPLVLSLRRQLEAFAAFAGGAPPGLPAVAGRGEGRGSLATAADGVAAMAVAEAARRSAEMDGAEVTVATATAGERGEGAVGRPPSDRLDEGAS